MSILVTKKLFYTHAWEAYLVGGLLIFLLGLFIGRSLWRHCRAYADRVEAMNDDLRKRKGVFADKNRQLAELVDKLPKVPKSPKA